MIHSAKHAEHQLIPLTVPTLGHVTGMHENERDGTFPLHILIICRDILMSLDEAQPSVGPTIVSMIAQRLTCREGVWYSVRVRRACHSHTRSSGISYTITPDPAAVVTLPRQRQAGLTGRQLLW